MPTLQENIDELTEIVGDAAQAEQADALNKRIQDQGDYHAIINQNPRHRRALHRALKDLETVNANVVAGLKSKSPNLNVPLSLSRSLSHPHTHTHIPFAITYLLSSSRRMLP